MTKQELNNHYDFLRSCNDQIPELASFIFSLRTVSYMGCGFHYSLEKQLGTVIRMCNDFDRRLEFSDVIINEVIWDGLVSSVNKIKEELKNR